ncbi:hypothetical protein ACET3Z_031857 [Daucus carota]
METLGGDGIGYGSWDTFFQDIDFYRMKSCNRDKRWRFLQGCFFFKPNIVRHTNEGGKGDACGYLWHGRLRKINFSFLHSRLDTI